MKKKPKRMPKPKNQKSKKKKPVFTLYESKIMNFLRHSEDNKYGSRELIRKTGIKDKDQFYSALKSLDLGGYITVDKKHKVKLNRDSSEVKGELVSLSKSFAFVKCENMEEDVFVHIRDLKGALLGDKVLLGDVKKDSKGFSGKVLRVIEEASNIITGTIQKNFLAYELIPDGSFRYNLVLLDMLDAKDGDKVLAEIVKDSRGEWTQAIVVKVFGSSESAKVCSDAIIERYGIPVQFSAESLKEAQEISETEVVLEKGRLDLRDEIIFTIDGADAKDLDDAISIKRTDTGYELGVHIADVSHYIKEKTYLDTEAMDRGTSVYFADRVIPMLPKSISNGICSLTSGTDKLCFSAFITFDENGKIQKYKFKKTIINSKLRGVYSEINEIFDNTASTYIKNKYAIIMDELNLSRELANILKKRSKSRGTMEIESSESRFILDENGVCIDVMQRDSGEAQELIEQFMISANMCAAKFSIDNDLPFLYRVHSNPDGKKLSQLIELLKALEVPCKELYGEKPSTADFQAILKRVKGTDKENIVSERLLRSMEKAKYSIVESGHFGLNLKDYSHFTSPIRRYPDTSIHRIMSKFLDGQDSNRIKKYYKNFCENSATNSTMCEIRAVSAERDSEDCYMAEYMSAHIGEEHKGTVSGIIKNGVFVRLASSVEGFVPIEQFRNHKFEFDGLISLKCKMTNEVLTIGMELEIVVASAKVATGRVDFSLKDDYKLSF